MLNPIPLLFWVLKSYHFGNCFFGLKNNFFRLWPASIAQLEIGTFGQYRRREYIRRGPRFLACVIIVSSLPPSLSYIYSCRGMSFLFPYLSLGLSSPWGVPGWDPITTMRITSMIFLSCIFIACSEPYQLQSLPSDPIRWVHNTSNVKPTFFKDRLLSFSH